MKKQKLVCFLRVSRIALLLIVFLISTFAVPQKAFTQGIAITSEYYIPGDADELFALLRDNDNSPELGNADVLNTIVGTCTTGTIPGNGGAGPCNYMHNITTVSVSSDGVTVYYDHWENGYGTGITGNDETYLVNRGDILTFESDNILVPRNANDTCISTNPNGNSSACYDGRDRIYVTGGLVSVSQAFWPEATQTVYANAWEVYPARQYQTNYTIPVGEDLAGAPLNYTDFTNVYIIVQATQDNTNVQIDDPGRIGSPDVNVTLGRGEVTQLFHVDSETKVSATAPIQTQFIVGQYWPGIDSDSRSYTAVSSARWSSSYYGPVPSFIGRGNNLSNTDVFVYNPTASAMIINYEDSAGSGSFVVPANSTRSYADLVGRYVPRNSALYLESASGTTFWAIGSVNTENPDYNYGFPFLPTYQLAKEYFLSWAPGTTNLSANGSPVFVTPAEDNTTVYVDYSPIDENIDDTFTLNRIEIQTIFDPDNDNTGMHIWATKPIAMVWGEDPDNAAIGNPYIDAGYTLRPIDISLPPPVEPPPDGSKPGGGGRPAGLIPVTGFAPGRVTDLSDLPVTNYHAIDSVTLEIPALKLKLPIVGIPMKGNTWDVNWLLNQAGWLEGSAFPGFAGNSVLTSHVTLHYGQPGPFANLYKLKTGDLIFVHAFGNLNIYKIKSVKKLAATDPSILQHEDRSWLTLVTCADYNENAETYLKRLVVKAVLVQTQPEHRWVNWP